MISLMNHINSDRDNPLFALAFSSEGELYGYLETKTLDVLLMDENIPLDESKVPVACRMIFMTRIESMDQKRSAITGYSNIPGYGTFLQRSSDI